MRTVLIATTGLTPAVLTETVWALAHETPAILPDEIIVLTTLSGAAKIAEQLFGADDLWHQLRRTLLGKNANSDPRLDFDTTPDRVRVVHHRVGPRRVPLDELTTPAQNTAFADAIVDELWKHTSKPDTRVIASLAGGFKTMSALMLSAMQLMANPGDRVTHVLVGGGYDSTQPPFHFPQQKRQSLRGRDGSPLRASAATHHLRLIDLPVIPLRRWFESALNRPPPSYDTLVHGGLAALETAAGDLALELSPVVLPPGVSKHWMRLNGADHPLSPTRFAYLRFFAEHTVAGANAFGSPLDAITALKSWLDHDTVHRERCLDATREGIRAKTYSAEDLPKRLKDLRTFLEKLPGGRALAATLPAKGRWGLSLPSQHITLH